MKSCRRWKKCSINWFAASIMMIVLPVTGCRSTRQVTAISASDSLTWKRKASVTLATMPASLAELTIPMDSLRKLPAGGSYTAKSGQAGLRLSYQDGNIHAAASCDSLQRLTYILEEELRRTRDQLEQSETEKEAPQFAFKCYLYGVITGIISLLIFQYTRKR